MVSVPPTTAYVMPDPCNATSSSSKQSLKKAFPSLAAKLGFKHLPIKSNKAQETSTIHHNSCNNHKQYTRKESRHQETPYNQLKPERLIVTVTPTTSIPPKRVNSMPNNPQQAKNRTTNRNSRTNNKHSTKESELYAK